MSRMASMEVRLKQLETSLESLTERLNTLENTNTKGSSKKPSKELTEASKGE